MKTFLIIYYVMLSVIGIHGMSIFKPEGNNGVFGSSIQITNTDQAAPRDVLLHYVEAFVDAEKKRMGGAGMLQSAYWSVSHYDKGRGTNATTATTTTTPPPPPTNPKTAAPGTTKPAPTTTPIVPVTTAPVVTTPRDTTTPLTTIIMAHPMPNLPEFPNPPKIPEIPKLPDLPWNSCNNKMWSGIWCPLEKRSGGGWGLPGGIGGGIGMFR